MADTDARRSLRMIRAAWSGYLVVVAGLGLVVLVAVVSTWPWPYYAAVERYLFPAYEAEFGFRWGKLACRDRAVGGIVHVTPGGRMAQAGVKAGDIPFEYHGGFGALYGAVRRAHVGDAAEFDVLTCEQLFDGGARRRIILVPGSRSDCRTEGGR